jgi:hypothetical protein
VEQPGNQGSSYVQDHTHNLARSNLQINQLAGLGISNLGRKALQDARKLKL